MAIQAQTLIKSKGAGPPSFVEQKLYARGAKPQDYVKIAQLSKEQNISPEAAARQLGFVGRNEQLSAEERSDLGKLTSQIIREGGVTPRILVYETPKAKKVSAAEKPIEQQIYEAAPSGVSVTTMPTIAPSLTTAPQFKGITLIPTETAAPLLTFEPAAKATGLAGLYQQISERREELKIKEYRGGGTFLGEAERFVLGAVAVPVGIGLSLTQPKETGAGIAYSTIHWKTAFAGTGEFIYQDPQFALGQALGFFALTRIPVAKVKPKVTGIGTLTELERPLTTARGTTIQIGTGAGIIKTKFPLLAERTTAFRFGEVFETRGTGRAIPYLSEAQVAIGKKTTLVKTAGLIEKFPELPSQISKRFTQYTFKGEIKPLMKEKGLGITGRARTLRIGTLEPKLIYKEAVGLGEVGITAKGKPLSVYLTTQKLYKGFKPKPIFDVKGVSYVFRKTYKETLPEPIKYKGAVKPMKPFTSLASLEKPEFYPQPKIPKTKISSIISAEAGMRIAAAKQIVSEQEISIPLIAPLARGIPAPKEIRIGEPQLAVPKQFIAETALQKQFAPSMQKISYKQIAGAKIKLTQPVAELQRQPQQLRPLIVPRITVTDLPKITTAQRLRPRLIGALKPSMKGISPVPPIIPTTGFFLPPFLPRMEVGERKRRVQLKGRRYKYQPSLRAREFRIFGKPQKYLTGLELRKIPLLATPRKRRKKRR